MLHLRCDGDAKLNGEVEELLSLDAEPELAMDRLKLPHAVPFAVRRFEPGDVVGKRYRIVRFLAAGGMGEVYEGPMSSPACRWR